MPTSDAQKKATKKYIKKIGYKHQKIYIKNINDKLKDLNALIMKHAKKKGVKKEEAIKDVIKIVEGNI